MTALGLRVLVIVTCYCMAPVLGSSDELTLSLNSERYLHGDRF